MRGRIRIIVLVLVCAGLGMAYAAAWTSPDDAERRAYVKHIKDQGLTKKTRNV